MKFRKVLAAAAVAVVALSGAPAAAEARDPNGGTGGASGASAVSVGLTDSALNDPAAVSRAFTKVAESADQSSLTSEQLNSAPSSPSPTAPSASPAPAPFGSALQPGPGPRAAEQNDPSDSATGKESPVTVQATANFVGHVLKLLADTNGVLGTVREMYANLVKSSGSVQNALLTSFTNGEQEDANLAANKALAAKYLQAAAAALGPNSPAGKVYADQVERLKGLAPNSKVSNEVAPAPEFAPSTASPATDSAPPATADSVEPASTGADGSKDGNGNGNDNGGNDGGKDGGGNRGGNDSGNDGDDGGKGTASSALVETGARAGENQDGDTFHVDIRAFIPGAGSKAAKGFAFSSVPPATLGKTSAFNKDYKLPSSVHGKYPGWGGYAVGWFELDEVFNSNHRDFSQDSADDAHSKTFTHVTLRRASGKWTKADVGKGCSRTEHYCQWGFWPFWERGLCCSKTAAPTANPVQSFSGSGSTASFAVKVKVGNPCVPASSTVAPIEHNINVKIDFDKKTFTYSGDKSRFPAFEVCFGRDPANMNCDHYGIEGRNFYDLMFSNYVIKSTTRSF